jgi:hypothetical protein
MNIEHHCWKPRSLSEVCQLLSELTIPWWIAGGMAIELFVGRTIREHDDIDILILRKDQQLLQTYLRGWDLHKTNQPGLKPWPTGEYLAYGVNQIWCRQAPDSPWEFEVMFMDTDDPDGKRWVYRRAPNIGGMLTDLGRTTSQEIPYVSPEIQLLYKARTTMLPKDEQDFAAVLPCLTQKHKMWLASALQVQFPQGHSWIPRLTGMEQ